MITTEQCMTHILSQIPAFLPVWQRHIEWWDNEPAGLCNDFSCLTNYAESLIKISDTTTLPKLFSIIEEILVTGDDAVKTAVATCFLESLQNLESNGRIDASKFVPLLGPESRRHCLAWDYFTGVKTPTLRD